jgi:HD-GYP domain-containing protein (c-di-GMP phosphodiesterase class II)
MAEDNALEELTAARSDESRWAEVIKAHDSVGTRIVSNLNALEVASRMYEMSNRVMTRILDDLMTAVNEYGSRFRSGAWLEYRKGNFQLNQTPVRLDFRIYKRASELKASFDRIGVRGLRFPTSVHRQDLKRFFELFFKVRQANRPECASLLVQIKTETGVEIFPAQPQVETNDELDKDRLAIQLYCILNVLVEKLMEAAVDGHNASLIPLKRAIQLVADHVHGREGLFLSVLNIKELQGNLASHTTNVTILSLLMGDRLGLEPVNMMELGLAGLFHDLSRVLITPETLKALENEDELGEAQAAEVAHMPFKAVRRLMQGAAWRSSESLARVIVSYENQCDFERKDLYRSGLGISTIARLIAVANTYESLVRPIGDVDPLLPAEAIHWLLQEKDSGHQDPMLLELFVQMMGLFPTGSLVRLNTDELAVVTGQGDDPDVLTSPRVDVFMDAEGERIRPFEVVLSDDTSRAIRSPLSPDEVDFDVIQYMLHDPEY